MKKGIKIEGILVSIIFVTIVGIIIYTEYDYNNILRSLAITIFWLFWLCITLYSYYCYTKQNQKDHK